MSELTFPQLCGVKLQDDAKCMRPMSRASLVDHRGETIRTVHFCPRHGKQIDEGERPLCLPSTMSAPDASSSITTR